MNDNACKMKWTRKLEWLISRLENANPPLGWMSEAPIREGFFNRVARDFSSCLRFTEVINIWIAQDCESDTFREFINYSTYCLERLSFYCHAVV